MKYLAAPEVDTKNVPPLPFHAGRGPLSRTPRCGDSCVLVLACHCGPSNLPPPALCSAGRFHVVVLLVVPVPAPVPPSLPRSCPLPPPGLLRSPPGLFPPSRFAWPSFLPYHCYVFPGLIHTHSLAHMIPDTFSRRGGACKSWSHAVRASGRRSLGSAVSTTPRCGARAACTAAACMAGARSGRLRARPRCRPRLPIARAVVAAMAAAATAAAAAASAAARALAAV